MAKRRGARRTYKYGPPLLTPPPLGQDGEGCEIIFGSNTEIKKVLMQFSRAADRLIFSPAEARETARQLLLRADLADGTKVS